MLNIQSDDKIAVIPMAEYEELKKYKEASPYTFQEWEDTKNQVIDLKESYEKNKKEKEDFIKALNEDAIYVTTEHLYCKRCEKELRAYRDLNHSIHYPSDIGITHLNTKVYSKEEAYKKVVSMTEKIIANKSILEFLSWRKEIKNRGEVYK